MSFAQQTVKELISKYAEGEFIKAEDYVREVLKGKDKSELRNMCKENEIYYKKGSNREELVQRLYGMVNTVLGYKVLRTSDVRNKSLQDFYKKIYHREYCKEVKIYD